MPVHKPAPLTPGAKIGILAPAGGVNEGLLTAGIEAIRAEGFEIELSPGIRETKGYLAGEEKIRARDLLDFFNRSDIGGIFCARGGFGSIQLLPYLAEAQDCWPPKIFVGYSDVTILLNWFLQNCAMVTFHAPMVAMDLARGLSERARKRFWGILSGEHGRWSVDLGQTIRSGQADGEMMGGCLSLLVTTLGTPYEIQSAGKILFIEDVGEKPYRVERMLTHLKMAGKLDDLAGVVFGDFTDCTGDGPRDIPEIIADLFSDVSYPVVMGMAAGHGSENLALPFGVRVALDGNRGTLSLLEPAVAG